MGYHKICGPFKSTTWKNEKSRKTRKTILRKQRSKFRRTYTGCPHRFCKKIPGHFQDKTAKFQGKKPKKSSLKLRDKHKSSE